MPSRRVQLVALGLIVVGIGIGVGVGVLVAQNAAAHERGRDVAATMRADPAWDVRVPGARVIEADHVEGCGQTRDRGSRSSTQTYEIDQPDEPDGPVRDAFADGLAAAGWSPEEVHGGWTKVIDGDRYDLDLVLTRDGRVLLEMGSPTDMCPIAWF